MGYCLLARANMDMAIIMLFEVILSLIFMEKKKINIYPADTSAGKSSLSEMQSSALYY